MDPLRREISHFDVEEIGLGLVSLENNIALSLIETWAMHLDHLDGSYITGSEGGIRLNPFGLFRSLGDLDISSSADLDAFDFRLHNVRENSDAYDGPLEHFIAAVQGRVAPIPTDEIALNTMLISEGIYLSQELNREVTSDEVISKSISTSQEV